jgi:hypothetical protein
MSGMAMSMEAALDEERKEVLALLEGEKKANRKHRGSMSSTGSAGSAERIRSSSPFTTSPRSPSRSMLDIAEEPAGRHASIAGTNTGITSPRRSMLDVDNSSSSGNRGSLSPTYNIHNGKSMDSRVLHPRSLSDASILDPEPSFGGKAGRAAKGDATSDYQLSGYSNSNSGGPAAPKRNSFVGKKPLGTSAMAAAMRGEDVPLSPGLYQQKDNRGRNPSIASAIGSKSRSPHSRLDVRSSSPHESLLSSSGPKGNRLSLDNGTVVDGNTAYRRLSDGNLALAGGSLAGLPGKTQKAHRDSSGTGSPEGGRLRKDYTYEEEGALADSSDEENEVSSDEETRGRKKAARGEESKTEGSPESKTVGMGRAPGPRTSMSLMAAAEEERMYRV